MGGGCFKAALPTSAKLLVGGRGGQARFFQSIVDCDIKKLKSLIKLDHNLLNAIDDNLKCGLHFACAAGHLKIVEFLLDAGAQHNVKDQFGIEPLLEAIEKGHRDVVDCFVNRGISLSFTNSRIMKTKLFELVSRGDLNSLRMFIRCGLSATCTNDDSQSLLQIAASHGHCEMVQYLIDSKSDLSHRDRWGGTALTDAIRENHKSVQEILTTAATNRLLRSDYSKLLAEQPYTTHIGCATALNDPSGMVRTLPDTFDRDHSAVLVSLTSPTEAHHNHPTTESSNNRPCSAQHSVSHCSVAADSLTQSGPGKPAPNRPSLERLPAPANESPISVASTVPAGDALRPAAPRKRLQLRPLPRAQPPLSPAITCESPARSPSPAAHAHAAEGVASWGWPPRGPVGQECTSVFFSDVVGFVTLERQLPAARLADMLRRLFVRMDLLAVQRGVRRVDVRGDVYLAAANLDGAQSDDHAARLARFALDAMEAAADTAVDEEGPDPDARVQIRVGLHCGPVSASLVGNGEGARLVHEDETFAAAAHLGWHSLPCRIQCSPEFAGWLSRQDPSVSLMLREGGVDVPGKGCAAAYWVCSEPGRPRSPGRARSPGRPSPGQSQSPRRMSCTSPTGGARLGIGRPESSMDPPSPSSGPRSPGSRPSLAARGWDCPTPWDAGGDGVGVSGTRQPQPRLSRRAGSMRTPLAMGDRPQSSISPLSLPPAAAGESAWECDSLLRTTSDLVAAEARRERRGRRDSRSSRRVPHN